MTSLVLYKANDQIFLECDADGQILAQPGTPRETVVRMTHNYQVHVNRGPGWDAGAMLHWMQLSPKVINCPQDISSLVTMGLVTIPFTHHELSSEAVQGLFAILCEGPNAFAIWEKGLDVPLTENPYDY